MTYYVYSTLSCGQSYTNYKQGGADVMIPLEPIHIKGGANVVDRQHLITPYGVMTIVNDDQMEQLEANEDFKTHKKNGFITVRQAETNIETAISDMASRDKAAPLVEQDYNEERENETEALPVVETKKRGRPAKNA